MNSAMETDFSVLHVRTISEIPGYKLILKSVLKSQIQMLVQQLSEYGEEECCILTASLTDGSIGHLGSNRGKNFLDTRKDLNSEFLTHCLTSQSNTHSKQSGTSKVHSENSFKPLKKVSSKQRQSPYNRSTITSKLTDERHNLTMFIDSKDMKTSFNSVKSENEEYEQRTDVAMKLETEKYESVENQTKFEEISTGVQSNFQIKFEDQAEDWNETGSETVILKETPKDVDLCASYLQDEGSNSWTPDDRNISPSSFTTKTDCATPSYKTEGAYDIQEHHSETAEDCDILIDSRGRRIYACKICGKIFLKKFDVKRHQSIHTGERFFCSHCPKSFSQKAALKSHEKNHLKKPS